MFVLLFVSGISISNPDTFHDNYMSKKQTTTINGIFVFLVVMSHAAQYISLDSSNTALYVQLRGFLGQAVVAPFLFYSGYGLMSSIEKKGKSYVNIMPLKVIKLLIQYDVAVLFFLIMNLFLGREMTAKGILLSLTSWGSLGNSNWYITATLILYIFIYLAFKLSRGKTLLGIMGVTILTVGIVYFFMKIQRPPYSYNTMICLPAGMFFRYIKDYFDKYISNDFRYAILALILFSIAAFCRINANSGIETYSFWVIAFSFCIVYITRKVAIESTMLKWLGEHIFSIYILQRIPMMVLTYFGLNQHYFIFFMVSLLITLIMSILFEKYIMNTISNFINKFTHLNGKHSVR